MRRRILFLSQEPARSAKVPTTPKHNPGPAHTKTHNPGPERTLCSPATRRAAGPAASPTRMLARTSRGMLRSAHVPWRHARGDALPNVEVCSGAHSPPTCLSIHSDDRAQVCAR